MEHWYFDEVMVAQRMREVERGADRARALGLCRDTRSSGWEQVWAWLGRMLVALGTRLESAETARRPDLVFPSQCELR